MELPLRYGQEDGVYSEFKTEGLHIALFKRQLMAEVLGTEHKQSESDVQDRQVLILRVDKVDEAYNYLVQKGVTFETPPLDRKEWECRTAHFRDPEGNLWELNADL